jgi:hypothetical protein
VVNCGGAAVRRRPGAVRIEQGLRATAAHSTLVLGDANSTAVLGGRQARPGRRRGRGRPAHAARRRRRQRDTDRGQPRRLRPAASGSSTGASCCCATTAPSCAARTC